MNYPKHLVAFVLAVTISGFLWYGQAQIAAHQLSYVQQGSTAVADNSGGVQLGFSESSAQVPVPNFCPGADLVVPLGLKYGDSGDDVRSLQKFLAWYYQLQGQDRTDLISGNFLLTTQSLLKQFQQDNDIISTGTLTWETYDTIRNKLAAHCRPRITSVDPLRPQRGDTVTLTGTNFPIKTPATIEIWQTDNGWFDQDFKFKATSTDGTTLSFVVPDTARVTGNHDDRFKIQITTAHGSSNEKWIYVFVCAYDWNRNVPQQGGCTGPTTSPTLIPTKTPGGGGSGGLPKSCSDYGTKASCDANNTNELGIVVCKWSNNACRDVGLTGGDNTPYCWNTYSNHGTKAAGNCNKDPRCTYDWSITGGGHCTGR